MKERKIKSLGYWFFPCAGTTFIFFLEARNCVVLTYSVSKSIEEVKNVYI